MRLKSLLRPCARALEQCRLTNTGFGPNRLYKQNTVYIGVHPPVLKYHVVQDKKANMPYGIQGVNHLNKKMGRVAGILPVKMNLKKDKIYAWCLCGHSNRQPLCDGRHNRQQLPTDGMHPVRFIPEKDMTVWFCVCKQTKNRPFCDGSHKECKDPYAVLEEQQQEAP